MTDANLVCEANDDGAANELRLGRLVLVVVGPSPCWRVDSVCILSIFWNTAHTI